MVEVLAKRSYSLEEYFEQELASEERHEFLDGEICPMMSGTPNHNQIALNLSGALNYHLRRQSCQVFMTD